jgi:acyl dehydratase
VSDSIKMPVEETHIMMFARSIGDDNPVYQNADAARGTEPGHVIAPPTFPRAVAQFDPDYHLRLKTGVKWFGSGKNPTGLTEPAKSTGGLHAEQHFEYHRTMKAGDVLTVTTRDGEKWEKESKRAGKLMFSETIQEYRDQNGELVVTSRSIGVKTERPVEQG